MNNNNGLDLNISDSEAKTGGLRYEVIISSPAATPPTKVNSPRLRNKLSSSAHSIQKKLEAAEIRRQSFEADKMANLAEKFKKIEEAAKKRYEEENNFINSTKENLVQKMETHIDKRESLIVDLKTKLSNHNTNKLKEVKQNLENSVNEFEEKAEKELISKLVSAEKNRERVIQERIESLKKLDVKAEMVRQKRNSSFCDNGHGDNVEAMQTE